MAHASISFEALILHRSSRGDYCGASDPVRAVAALAIGYRRGDSAAIFCLDTQRLRGRGERATFCPVSRTI